MVDDVLNMDDEQKVAAEEIKVKAAAEAAKQQDREAILKEIDARIEARDKVILEAMQQLAESVKSGRVEEKKPDEMTIEQVGLTPEDFWRDPVTSLEKFYKIKIAPAIAEERKKKDETIDTSGLQALIETKKIRLRESSSEEFNKYAPFFDKVAQRTDPTVLATDQGFDAVWRLTKSYTDDFLADEERKRQEKLRHVNLVSGTGVTPQREEEVKYTDDERAIMDSMGISPELYKKYSKVEEIEIGGNLKKKK